MAYATSIRHTNFQFDGTAITKIYDNQSLDYPYSSFTLVSHIYVTPVDAEVDWSVQVGPVRPGPDETIVFGPITAAQDPGHYTITATVDISAEGWRTIGVSELNSDTSFPLSITYPGHSSYSGGYMEFSPDFQYIDSGVSAPYTYFPLYDSQSPSGITLVNVVASGFTFEPSYNGNTLSYKGVKSVSWDDDELEYGGPQLYMDPNNQKVVANNFKANTGLRERRFRAWFPIGDTRGNSWIDDFTFIQKSEYSDPPIPSGETTESGSTSHTITYSGCPLVFDHSASTGTWNTLPTVTTGGTTNDWWITYDVPANDTDSARTITYYYLRYSGETCEDLVDTVSYTISQAAGSGSTPTDSYIRFSESARTVNGNAGATSVVLDYSGCTPYGGSKAFSATGTLDVTGVSVFHGYDSVTCSISFPSNTGSTSLQADVRVEFDDTSGNTYYDTIRITQGVQTDINFSPNTHEIQGQANRVTSTAVPLNCTVSSITFLDIQYTQGTWDEYPVYTINGNDVTFAVPANNTNNYRVILYRFTITDTDGNTYTKSISIVQMAQSRWVYLNPSGRTHNAYTDASTNFNIRGSGCSIDNAYTPTFTFSGDTSWISSIERVSYSRLQSAWLVYYKVSRNLGLSGREIYITANGVHDTDGNVYNDLVYHATQNYGSYVFLNYDKDHSAPSGSSVETVEVVPVNTTVCSVSVTGSSSTTPDFWTGVTQPTVTILGNYITVNWPENPYSANRNYQLNVEVVWGENCENTTTLTFNKNQNAGSTPVQKDIKAADTDYSVGSGTGNASTTIQTSGCTFDHFTFITGGSFSVTATSGPNNTIVFTYPENPTTSPRTGYVYITFYDSDGNTYGPQTITFTQQAGSSPGPGPGPDPETGYVLTTLTISDQEQHRYFVEARPGVVYSAAGQYYKTVLACEARYSLYYVNSYGGVDVLPFKEKSWKKSDTVTRFNYSRSFRNNTLEFENVNYMNEIKASWELHTGWMSDESSQRMHELVESTIVYLYDAEEKTYTPVVMTDKKLEYKTYYNQGKKFYNYTVNVEESQSKERR